MGQVRIEVLGSFLENVTRVYSAEEGGHAHALARAIGRLVELLPEAIKKDHELQAAGERPPRAHWGTTTDVP